MVLWLICSNIEFDGIHNHNAMVGMFNLKESINMGRDGQLCQLIFMCCCSKSNKIPVPDIVDVSSIID